MSVGGGESNQDAQTSVFQNMVARLMGHAPDVAPVQKRPQASPSTPRSVPAVSSSSRASSTTQSPALLSTQRENTNPPSYLTDRAPSTRSSASNGDLTLTDATTGPPLPSLFGTAEQLADARGFSITATRGGSKARSGPASSRQRVISSPRPVKIAAVGSPIRADKQPVLATHRTQLSAAVSITDYPAPGGSGVAVLHDRPQIERGEPSARPTESANNRNSFLSGMSFGKSEDTQSEERQTAKTRDMPPKEALAHAHPSSAAEVKKLNAHQQIESMKTQEARRTEPSPKPGHLDRQVAAAGMPDRVPPHRRPKDSVKRPTHAQVSSITQLSPTTKEGSSYVQQHDVQVGTKHIGIVGGDELVPIEKTRLIDPPPTANSVPPTMVDEVVAFKPSKAPATMTNDAEIGVGIETLKTINQQLDLLMDRLEFLEKENFDIQGQLQKLVQAEERRKYLGTDESKAPFGLKVECPSGEICNVQVHGGLKVYQLVRRVCSKCNVTLTVHSKPRIAVNGTEVGHGMMLGELGIVKDSDAEVELRYDV